MRIPAYLELVHRSEGLLAASYRRAANDHPDEPEIASVCGSLARQCDEHQAAVGPLLLRHGAVQSDDVPTGPPPVEPTANGSGSFGLLRDLEALWMSASFVHLVWTVVQQAAQGLRDHGLVTVAATCDRDTEVQLQWLTTRIRQVAPQALIAGR